MNHCIIRPLHLIVVVRLSTLCWGEGRDERSDLVLTVVCLRPVTLFAAEGKRIWPRSTMRIFTRCGGEGMGGHNQIWYLSSDIFAESHPVCSRRKEEDKADIS
jgi:hypothetical protein